METGPVASSGITTEVELATDEGAVNGERYAVKVGDRRYSEACDF